MNEFVDIFRSLSWEEISDKIYNKTASDVLSAINETHPNLDDLMALISPAALPYLEQIAAKSRQITRKRFGNTIQLFAPMYLSNECNNICTYCGFSFHNKIRRRTLSDAEILDEAKAIRELGFNHILLVTGEDNRQVNAEYIRRAVELLKPVFSNISIEVQPLHQHEYEMIHHAGVHSVLVYQETYHEENYKTYHTKGKKSNFLYRLQTPERIGNAGIHKIGLGVLLGLEDWRTDSWFCALHLDFLQRRYWRTKYAISFPRIRPATGMVEPKSPISDRELVQLICAYRLFNPDLELSISTRESAKFRDHVVQLGITSMSAGSKTNPGGYSVEPESLEQFQISDERSPAEVAVRICEQGYQPVWKDWDQCLNLADH